MLKIKMLNEEILVHIMLVGVGLGTLALLFIQIQRAAITLHVSLSPLVEDVQVITLPEVIVTAPRRIASALE